MQMDNRTRPRLRMPDLDAVQNQGVVQCQALLEALKASNRTIRALAIEDVSPYLFMTQTSAQRNTMVRAITPLHKLVIEFDNIFDYWGEYRAGQPPSGYIDDVIRPLKDGCLRDVIRIAEGLRELHLSLHLYHESHLIRMEELIGEPTWPLLESLILGGVYADEEVLHDLLMRHKTTLRKLSLEQSVVLRNGTWTSLLQRIGGQLQRLQVMDLPKCLVRGEGFEDEFMFWNDMSCVDNTSYQRAIEKFVIKGGEWPKKPDDYQEH